MKAIAGLPESPLTPGSGRAVAESHGPMSLFSTIQQSSGALQAAQIGLQVVGNNIANAHTEGYVRTRLEQSPAAAVRTGNLILGQGVRPTGIRQVFDKALIGRLYSSITALESAETITKAYLELEEITTDLENTGLNHQLSLFNNALHELSTQPNDPSAREFVILQGEALADRLRSNYERALERQRVWNMEIAGYATDINRLTDRIAKLNVEISTLEGGGLSGSDATGLRDQRYRDLQELATLIDINIQEVDNGNLSVFVGGDYLISEGIRREVVNVFNQETGEQEIRIAQIDSPLQVKGGKLAGTLEARNRVFGGYLNDLEDFTGALIRTVNRVHSQGQGRVGFDQVMGGYEADAGAPLARSGLPWVPDNGEFQIQVIDRDDGVVSGHTITVRQLGLVGDSSIGLIAGDIDAIPGLTATVDDRGRLRISSDSPATRFTFGEDTSGFLAAVGINTFFDGTGARDVRVNRRLTQDHDLLAISQGGIGADTDNLTELTDLIDRPMDFNGGRSVRGIHEQSMARIGQRLSLQKGATEGLRDFKATLESRHLALTGVNIDEEAIKLISYQRAFQASSRVISTASEMLEILVNL